MRRHQLWLRQSSNAGCIDSTIQVRDVELHSNKDGSLHVAAGFISKPLQLRILSNTRLPCSCAEAPFLEVNNPQSINERNVSRLHCALLAIEFSCESRTIFSQMSCEIASSWFVPPQPASTPFHKSASLHAQTELLSVTCDAAPSHYVSLTNTSFAAKDDLNLKDWVPPLPASVPPIKTTGAVEIGLQRSHSEADFAGAFNVVGARLLTQWLHDAAGFDALQSLVRHALDAIAMDFQEPILRVRWQYKGAHPAKRMATVLLEGACCERGQNKTSEHLSWALAVTLHSGQLRPYYVGSSSLALETASLFSPDTLHTICASAFGHGLDILKFLVRSAMEQLGTLKCEY